MSLTIERIQKEFDHYYECYEDIPEFVPQDLVKEQYVRYEKVEAAPCKTCLPRMGVNGFGRPNCLYTPSKDATKTLSEKFGDIPLEVHCKKNSIDREMYKVHCPDCHCDLSNYISPNDIKPWWKLITENHPPRTQHCEYVKVTDTRLVPVDRKTTWDEFRQEYMQSPLWRARRKFVMERDGYTCRCCGAPGEEVHHRTYKRIGREILADLVLMCGPCHSTISFTGNQ